MTPTQRKGIAINVILQLGLTFFLIMNSPHWLTAALAVLYVGLDVMLLRAFHRTNRWHDAAIAELEEWGRRQRGDP